MASRRRPASAGDETSFSGPLNPSNVGSGLRAPPHPASAFSQDIQGLLQDAPRLVTAVAILGICHHHDALLRQGNT